MADVGKPISVEERRSRSLDHLLLYGIKMMVRRDIGGRHKIDDHADVVSKQLMGMTAVEAGEFVVDKLKQQIQGIKDRQSRTVEEIARRDAVLTEATAVASAHARKGMHKEAYDSLLCGAHAMRGVVPPVADPTPESHILV